MKMWQSFGINVLLAITWGMLQGTTSIIGYVIGFIFSFLVTWLVSPNYGRRSLRGVAFIFFVTWQIILSAIRVTSVIIAPGDRVRPGIVAIPLELQSHAEVLILATVITLTPGTNSVETGTDATGRIVLFVHALEMDDPDALRTSIKRDFETRILGFMRDGAATGGAA
jgi:multicomponent Na+:H+ antiporter subunit E